MKRTLYPKLLAGYLMYGLIGFLIITTFTYHITFAFVEKKEAASLYRESALISSNYAGNYFSKTMTLDEIQTQLSTLSTYLSSEIWIVDTHGNIILNTAAPGCDPTPVPGFNITDFGSRYYQTGTFYNQFTSEMLSVFSPITVNYKVRGYVVIHKPTSSLVSYANGLVAIAYETLGLLFLAAFVVLILFTYVVYIPIRKITKAADEYAAGNFEKKIDVHSNDEIGYLAASLNYMANELNTLEDDQKKFVSNVSHDFRSPLTSIKGYVEAMTDGTIPPELHEKYLKIILFETERLTDLTQDLLTLNEFDTNHLLLNREVFDIHEMIKHVAASFEGVCTQKKISIELVFATKHLNVNADKRKIQQVLYNLLDNAIKFSDPNSIVTIETTDRGEKVYTSVKDNGMGIPRSALGKIWERFYKSDLSRGKDKKGTGLGLAIVKEAIQAHGENITVVSTEGVGTEFSFSLPKVAG